MHVRVQDSTTESLKTTGSADKEQRSVYMIRTMSRTMQKMLDSFEKDCNCKIDSESACLQARRRLR